MKRKIEFSIYGIIMIALGIFTVPVFEYDGTASLLAVPLGTCLIVCAWKGEFD